METRRTMQSEGQAGQWTRRNAYFSKTSWPSFLSDSVLKSPRGSISWPASCTCKLTDKSVDQFETRFGGSKGILDSLCFACRKIKCLLGHVKQNNICIDRVKFPDFQENKK